MALSFDKFVLIFALFFCILIQACKEPNRNRAFAHVPQENIEKGKVLAGQYCATCHLLPDPKELDARTWENAALPAMGPLMGIFNHRGQAYTYRGDMAMMGPGFMVREPVVSSEEWGYIVDYYTATAPDRLPVQGRGGKIPQDLEGFEVLRPEPAYPDPRTCFVTILEDSPTLFVWSDAVSSKTYFLDKNLEVVDSIQSDGPLLQIEFTDEGEGIACDVGVFKPNNDARGSAVALSRASGNWQIDGEPIFKDLRRPMQVSPIDLNADGAGDYLLCEFGLLEGSLSWMENLGAGTWQKHMLSQRPGVLKAYPLDYNEDGSMDIIALFSQGQEGIYLFLNRGDGSFEEKPLLQFPAVYGSSYFELADMNGDGLQDIIYTAGDNADYTPVLKPYHGVYIYINKGEEGFEQEYFYPIHGCYKAMADDFDGDGDLDLAGIAFFADFAMQPEEGFVYLENVGGMDFKPHSSPTLQEGRWISMDTGDYDGDGRTDIILGNYAERANGAKYSDHWAKAPPLTVLRNVGK